MSEIKLSPDEYAQIMKESKPHLIELEEYFADIDYGEIDVRFEIRAGVVNKMSFFTKKSWLKPKDLTQKGT